MLLKELLKKLQEIDNQQKQLKQDKKDLIEFAKQNRILEVNLQELAKFLSEYFNEDSYKIYTIAIYTPNEVYNNLEKAKEYIVSCNMGLGIRIEVYNTFKFTMPIKDVKLITGEQLIDKLKFRKLTTNMFVPNELVPLIMLNISLDDKNMEKEYFKQAVFKCVEKRENEKQVLSGADKINNYLALDE